MLKDEEKTDESPLDTTTRLNGYFPSDFELNEVQGNLPERRLLGKDKPQTIIRDARALPNAGVARTSSDLVAVRDFFWNHSFCCLSHKSQVQDWNNSNEIRDIYKPELRNLIQNVLLSDYNIIEIDAPNSVTKRGIKGVGIGEQYGIGVHCDWGQTLEDHKAKTLFYAGAAAPRKNAHVDELWQREDVEGCIVLVFWHPLETVYRRPLAVCDAASVTSGDVVRCYKANTSSVQLGLRYNPEHQWYYYSHMTPDETLAFKLIEVWKQDDGIDPRSLPTRGCFHSAFEDPNTPEDAPPRRSTELRVTVFFGKSRRQET